MSREMPYISYQPSFVRAIGGADVHRSFSGHLLGVPIVPRVAFVGGAGGSRGGQKAAAGRVSKRLVTPYFVSFLAAPLLQSPINPVVGASSPSNRVFESDARQEQPRAPQHGR